MTDSVSPAEKYCPDCQQTKPLSDFYPHRWKGKETYKSQCKPCFYLAAKRRADKIKQLRANQPFLLIVPQEKTCSVCQETKLIEAFKKDSSLSSGHKSICKKCHNASHKMRKASSDPIAIRASRRNSLLKCEYNLTPEQYDRMVEEQHGLCAVCKRPETRIDRRTGIIRCLSIDHDHKTGKVRRLLCATCNSALGLLGDDPVRIAALLKYIQQHTTQ